VRKVIQWGVRLVLLAAAVTLAAGGPLPVLAARVVPALSPLVAVTSSVAQRTWYLGAFWFVPPLAVLLLAFWKGRLFCRWICPAGTIYAAGSRWSLKKRLLRVRLNAYLFWAILGASLVGAPLLAWLDPLSTFSRIGPLLRGTYTLASLVPGVLLPVLLLLGVVQPMIWCTHVCPLGYGLELARSIRRRPKETFRTSRRQVIAGLAVGVPLAAGARWLGAFAAPGTKDKPLPVLPPGAADPETFASLCTRCYACVDVCPTKIIRVDLPAGRAVGQLFQPEVVVFDSEKTPDCGYCPEPCNLCSDVCPTGALRPLSFEEKWHRQIGVAEVIREACLAWEDGEDCVVCQEVCPYHAVDMEDSPDGRARPVINKELCRGCGACYSKCPAVRKGKALVIRGVERQRLVDTDTPSPMARLADQHETTA